MSFFLDVFPPNDKTSLELDGLNASGNGDSDDIPRADFPERSALARKDDRMEPVWGHSTVSDPPPPFGVTTVDGLVVVIQTTDFDDDDMVQTVKETLGSFFRSMVLEIANSGRTLRVAKENLILIL